MVVMHYHLQSLTAPVASGTFRVSLRQSPAALSESHCASRRRHFQSLTAPVASGTFRVSLRQSPAAFSESHCASRQRHLPSLTALVASGTRRKHTTVMCFDAFTAMFMIRFDTVLTGKLLPTFRIDFLRPSSR